MSNHTTAAPSSALSTLPAPEIGRLQPLRPLPLRDVQRAMAEYQEGLHALLDSSDWQAFADRDGRERRFVKRSGWRKVATYFGLDLLVGEVTVARDADGEPLRARVTGRVVAPNGRVGEDVGACSITERRFSKPEHDLIATATTRALNRATSNLVGMGELSAEELDDEPTFTPQMPEWALPATDEQRAAMTGKLVELVGEARARALFAAIDERYSGTPNIATGFVNAVHSMLADELADLRELRAHTQPPSE